MARLAPAGGLDLAQLRSQMRLSRERFGRLLDVSAKTIERWEEAGKLPSGAMVRQRLAQIQEIAEL